MSWFMKSSHAGRRKTFYDLEVKNNSEEEKYLLAGLRLPPLQVAGPAFRNHSITKPAKHSREERWSSL